MARVWSYIALADLRTPRDLYRLAGYNPTGVRNCMDREWKRNTISGPVRTKYAAAMGLTLNEFDQPLADFLSTLKLRHRQQEQMEAPRGQDTDTG